VSHVVWTRQGCGCAANLRQRKGRAIAERTTVTDAAAREMPYEAGFDVVTILRLLEPVSETHALVLRDGSADRSPHRVSGGG